MLHDAGCTRYKLQLPLLGLRATMIEPRRAAGDPLRLVTAGLEHDMARLSLHVW